MRRIIGTTLFAVLLIGGIGSGGAAESKLENAQKDARILGSVLEELLSEPIGDGEIWAGQAEVRGLYFDGYGLLFLVEPGGSHAMFGPHAFTAAPTEAKPDSQKAMGELQARIRTFYTQYARTAAALSEGDRITLRVNSPAGERPGLGLLDDIDVDVDVDVDLPSLEEDLADADTVVVVKKYGLHLKEIEAEVAKAMQEVKKATAEVRKMRFVHGSDAPRLPTLEATARVADIRNGKSDGSYVTFRTIGRPESGDRSIRIMADILESGLSDRVSAGLNRYLPWSGDDVTGFHLEGLGAVFFVNASGGHRVYEVWHGGRRASREEDSTIDTYRNEVISLIADYGGTLRSVASDESVTVHVGFGQRGRRPDQPGGLVVRAKKSVLDRYAAGKVDLEGLKRTMDIQVY